MIKHKILASVQSRILLVLSSILLLVLLANIFVFRQSSQMVQRVTDVFATNSTIVGLSGTLSDAQSSMHEYLSTHSSYSLEDFYRYEQKLRDGTQKLNDADTDNELLMLEKNIRRMTGHYLEKAEDAILARRGRNVEEYKASYAQATALFGYINNYIYALNSKRFRQNSENYKTFMQGVNVLEATSLVLIVAVSIFALLLAMLLVGAMIGPMKNLAAAANRVAQGDLSVEIPALKREDEVGVVTNAFREMLDSIRVYIISQRTSMEKEVQMKERELSMEAHLKEAQLKFLQAQINPHFLFNSLNAGSQLAMMEGADRTENFLTCMADFFRYNVKKTGGDASLEEEVATVDNYVYILNVRFAGDIHYVKQIDEMIDLGHIRMPSMILQPIVENAIQHGIHDDHENGIVTLAIDRSEARGNETGADCTRITVTDNGIGLTREQIAAIIGKENAGRKEEQDEKKADSTGIAMANVISRLELYYNRQNLFSIWSDGPGTGTEVTVLLPEPGEKKQDENVKNNM